MIKTSQTLAPNEQFRLEQCEKAIERGLNTFVEVGRALTEIRDAKLYRIGFKTFEAYCKERWEIDRSRAYQLIGQANVVAAIKEVAGDLSNAFDISKRDADVVKDNLPAITAEIKTRVEQGEVPEQAAKAVIEEAKEKAKTEKAAKKADREAEQAEWDRQRDENKAKLSPEVQASQQAKADAIAARKTQPVDVDALQAEIEELRDANTALEADNARLKADHDKWEGMRIQFEKGGFEEVIAGKDEEIRVLQGRLEQESGDKVAYLNKAEWWKKKAIELGYSSREVIDLDA